MIYCKIWTIKLLIPDTSSAHLKEKAKLQIIFELESRYAFPHILNNLEILKGVLIKLIGLEID